METARRTRIAIKKRIPAEETGGKSRSPILITNQVELHTIHSVSHAIGTPQPTSGRHLCLDVVLTIFMRAQPSRLASKSAKIGRALRRCSAGGGVETPSRSHFGSVFATSITKLPLWRIGRNRRTDYAAFFLAAG